MKIASSVNIVNQVSELHGHIYLLFYTQQSSIVFGDIVASERIDV